MATSTGCNWKALLVTGCLLGSGTIPGVAVAASVDQCSGATRAQASAQGSGPADPDLKQFHDLRRDLRRTFLDGNYPSAKLLAAQYLALAVKYPCDKGYGDAIFLANSYLGRISFKAGDVTAASNYLLEAGKTPGSQLLDSVGPDLALANQLLNAGQVGTVIRFLQQIRVFWKPGQRQIDSWTADIEAGKRPYMNPLEAAGTGTVIAAVSIVGFYLLVPVILALIVFCAAGRKLQRKWSFLTVSCVVSYAAVLLLPSTHLADRSEFLAVIAPVVCIFAVYLLWRARERTHLKHA
jgi:hypothetical protein